MIDIENWITSFQAKLTEAFGNRIYFVGLQGSYGRGEATETSDIDIVVILNKLTTEDIQAYETILNNLPHRELTCGFLSGINELLNWEPSDLFQFYYDTTPIQGSLDALLALIDKTDIDRAIKISACNIYHGCIHNMLYEKSEDILKDLYKAASFAVQAIHFKQTGNYIKQQKELHRLVSPDEQIIIDTFLKLKSGNPIDFDDAAQKLLTWAQNWISKITL